MEPWLKAKTAGLPRWAWLGMATGAIVIGLYLRNRNSGEEEPEENEEEESAGEGNTLEELENSESAGGLAAAGLVGPAQGSITPVEAPYVPEAIPEVIGSQSETIQTLAGAIAAQEPGERVETTVEREIEPAVTGGGPTKRKPHHKAPKKPHTKKPHTKKVHHAKAKKPKHHSAKPKRRKRR